MYIESKAIIKKGKHFITRLKLKFNGSVIGKYLFKNIAYKKQDPRPIIGVDICVKKNFDLHPIINIHT